MRETLGLVSARDPRRAAGGPSPGTGSARTGRRERVGGNGSAVTEPDLEWTIARITNPADKPATGRVRAGFGPGPGRVRAGFLGHDDVGSAMSHADIAAFLVDQLTDTTYLKAAPAVSN